MSKNPPNKPPISLVPNTPQIGPKPPATLGTEGKSLWNRVLSQYKIVDVGGLEMLAQAAHAAGRAASLARQIEQDGEVISTRMGLKAHPCLKDELACRAFFSRTMQRLGLDVEPKHAGRGNPGHGGIGWLGPTE